MYFLYKAIDSGLGVGVSYAVWAAIGAAGSVLMGIFLLAEPVSFWRIFFLTLLVVSVVGFEFKLSSGIVAEDIYKTINLLIMI